MYARLPLTSMCSTVELELPLALPTLPGTGVTGTGVAVRGF